MGSLRRTGWAGLLMAGGACCALLAMNVAFGAKPGGGGGGGDKDTRPPVTPAHNFTVFESRPDLGGVLDTSTNVVWGYSFGVEGMHNFDYTSALLAPARYPSMLLETAQKNQEYAEYCLQQMESDPERAHLWQAEADKYFATVQPLTDAGTVASQYGNWRLPTFAEAQDAVAKGLFTYGDGGLNKWTWHPAYPPPMAPEGTGWYWSADAGGKKPGGGDSGWTFNAFDGSGWRIVAFSRVLVVRTHTPNP